MKQVVSRKDIKYDCCFYCESISVAIILYTIIGLIITFIYIIKNITGETC